MPTLPHQRESNEEVYWELGYFIWTQQSVGLSRSGRNAGRVISLEKGIRKIVGMMVTLIHFLKFRQMNILWSQATRDGNLNPDLHGAC